MRTATLQEEMECCAAADRSPTVPFSMDWISNHKYDKLTSWMFQSISCDKVTCSLAKIYLDRYLAANGPLNNNELLILAVSSVRLAVKFNQPEQYPVSMAVQVTQHSYQPSEFIDCQNKLICFLGFRLKFTTPHCYLRVVKELLPGVDQTVFQRLDMVIEYCQLVKDFANLPSGSLFFGSLLYLVKEQRCQQLISRLVLILGGKYPRVEEIASLLSRKIDSTVNEQDIEFEEDLSDMPTDCSSNYISD